MEASNYVRLFKCMSIECASSMLADNTAILFITTKTQAFDSFAFEYLPAA